MRPPLQSVLDSVRELQPEELPVLLGELEIIRATALMRITQPTPVVQADELLGIEDTAERLGVSVDYVYRNAKNLPFTRRIGRKLLFSSRGIDQYISRKR
jgi:excisionase family DNA binding protein